MIDDVIVYVIVSFFISDLVHKACLRVGGFLGKAWQEKTFRSSKILRWFVQGFAVFAVLAGLATHFMEELLGNLSFLIIAAFVLITILILSGLVKPFLTNNPEKFPSLVNIFEEANQGLIMAIFALLFFKPLSFLNVFFPAIGFLVKITTPLADPTTIMFQSGLILYAFANYLVWGWPYDPPKRKPKEVTVRAKQVAVAYVIN